MALWDVFSGTPRLLCSGPEGEEAQEAVGGSGAAVTCLCLCVAWPLGLVITGHHKGEVRVYQFSSSERQADCVTLSRWALRGARAGRCSVRSPLVLLCPGGKFGRYAEGHRLPSAVDR